MMLTVQIDDAAARASLQRLRTISGGDAPRFYKQLGVIALAEIGANFRAGGRPAWAPLAESTRLARRGKGQGLPLRDTGALEKSFDLVRAADGEVVIVSRSPVAVFHEFGTKGPYEIRGKRGQPLALPFLPGRDSGQQGTAGRGAGRKSFAGLGASRRTRDGGLIFQPRGTVPARLRGREGKRVVAQTRTAFYQKVVHPGLVARPMLPTAEQMGAAIERVVIAHVEREQP